MNGTKPELGKALKCLSAFSYQEPQSITQVFRKTKINRNFISALLNSCVNFSLAEVHTEGRSEKFKLTLKALIYAKILSGDHKFVRQEIQKILSDAETTAIPSRRKLDVADQFLGSIEAKGPSQGHPPYLRLQTLTDAFTLASYGYFNDTPEHKILNEVASLLKAASPIFSPSKELKDLGKKFLQRALDMVESMQMAEKMIEQTKVDKSPLSYEKIGKDKRGRFIYRMK